MRKYLAKLVAASAIAVAATHGASAATLQGDTITVEYLFPNLGTVFGSDTIVAGAGVEIDCPGASGACNVLIEPYSLDFGVNTISFQQSGTTNSYATGSFNGWSFTGIDFGSGIAGVSLASSGIPGLGSGDVSFTADSILIDFSNTTGGVSDPNSWTLTLAAVPLPAAGWMLLAGIGGIAGLKRRKKRTA